MTKTRLRTLDDPDLVRRVVAGDVHAFEVIYDRHSAQVFGTAMHVTGRRKAAEEATQDAFLSFWRTAASYDCSKGALRSWLLSMARNRSIDWLRRETRHDCNLEIGDPLVEQLEAAERTEQEVANREESIRVRQLVASLPKEQRQVIELAYFKGLTQTEIAAKVKIPLGTVKGRQRLALKKLHLTLISAPDLVPTCAPVPNLPMVARIAADGVGGEW